MRGRELKRINQRLTRLEKRSQKESELAKVYKTGLIEDYLKSLNPLARFFAALLLRRQG